MIRHTITKSIPTNATAAVALMLILIVLFGGSIGYAQTASKTEMGNRELSIMDKIDSLLYLSDNNMISAPRLALNYADSALELSEMNAYDIGVANSNYRLGRAHTEIGNLTKAKFHLDQCLELYQQQKDSTGLVLTYKWLGSTQVYQNNEEALRYYSLAEKLAKEINLAEEIPKIMINLANIFTDEKQYNKAIEYLQKSCNMMKESYNQSACMGNLGLVYNKMGDYETAMIYYDKSLEICKRIDDPDCELFPLSLMTTIYLEQENYDMALEYSFKILAKEKIRGTKTRIVVGTNQIGQIYLSMKKFDLAFKYFDQSRMVAEEINYSGLPYTYANLSLASEGMENYKLALKYLWNFQNLKDSISTARKKQALDEQLVKFDTEKKEQEITLLQKEKELQEAELAKQKLTYTVIFFGGLLALIVSFIFILFYRQKVKASQQLVTMSNLINEQKTEKLIQENEIIAINANIEGQEKERIRIAQELHDGIAGNLASIRLSLSKLPKYRETELQPIINHVDNTYKEVRIISHHLMPPNVSDVPFEELIYHYTQDISEISGFELKINCHNLGELSDEIKIETYRIIQELMNNIVKHAHAKSVDIQLIRIEDNLNLLVEDSGVGFDQGSKFKGIGINNISSRVDKLNGKVHIESILDKGTIVNIDIPIHKEVPLFT